MAYYPATPFVPQFFNDAGVPLSGGTITAYLADTTTPTNMFIDDAGTSAGSVITLNARGEPAVSGNTVVIWLNDDITYKFTLRDASSSSKWTINDLSAGSSILRRDLAVDDNEAKGAGLIGYRGRTVHDRLDDIASVKDYGAVGDGVTNDAAAIAAAFAAHKHVVLPDGDYLIDGATLEPQSGSRIYGPGRIVKSTTTGTEAIFKIDAKDNIHIVGVQGKLTSGDAIFAYCRNSTRVKILECQVGKSSELWNGGIAVFFAKDCRDVQASRNIIHGGLAGVATGGDPLLGSGTDDGQVTRVQITDNIICSTNTEAIDINWHTRGFVIANNIGNNIGRRGDADNQAIDIGGSVDGTGSLCRDGEVYGNIFYLADTSANGVGFTNGQNGCEVKQWTKNVRVFDNQFYGAGQAATFGLKYSNTTECDFSRNICDGFQKGGYYLGTCIRSHMRGNIFLGVTQTGISFGNGGSYTDCYTPDNDITGSSATENGIDMRDVTGGDVSGTIIRGGFTSSTSGLGIGILINTDCSDITARGIAVDGCRQGVNILGPNVRVLGGVVENCTTYGLLADAADIMINGLKLLNNVSASGSEWQARFQTGCDRLAIVSITADDSNGSPKARGLQFLGGANCTISGMHVPRYLTTAITGLENLTSSSVELRNQPYTVATLPAAPDGTRAFVSDANATTFASVVAAGGANKVPVYRDGANWRIG